MANKTATLKNQAGDNIYPNIVGDNMNTAIKDSTTIKHTLAENKISLDLDETIKGKIDAALQKPTGLTKTKLVGVGASGQENIEIGDNLTLTNGKLAAAGGSVSPTLNLIDFENGEIRTSITEEEYNNLKNGLYNSINYYTETEYEACLPSKLISVYDDSSKSLDCLFSSVKITGTSETDISSTNIVYQLNIDQKDTSGNYPITIEKATEIPVGSNSGGGGPINIITKGDEDNKFNGTLVSPGLTLFSYKVPDQNFYVTMPINSTGLWGTSLTVDDETGEMTVYTFLQFNKRYGTTKYHLKYYSHFITMTDSSSNIALYLTIQNNSVNEFNWVSLGEYLAGKKVLVNGNLHGVVPTYIAGEGGVIKVHYMTPGDNNINPQPDEFTDLSSFEITDTVKPVE